ncbi:hypothetical protein CXB51_010377 [Gossypium anomalum]|uniref:Aminotransferase-like plant mobile domain-containing protein n=1 Tax=Gossypium anomalum TaxID=47600 RepID=A0A8J5ZND9_9ROSI|nr:hypothetical protein CXB51_010377 [Gossypium anomalum]
MAGKLIRLDTKHIPVDQMTMRITCGKWVFGMWPQYAGVQVGLETNQCIDREVETQDAHFSSSIRREYYHSGRRAIAIGIVDRWIEIGWLRDTFPEPDNDSTELERIRYARAYILEMIGGYLMPDLSRNRIHLRWLLKLIDFRAAGMVSLSIFTSLSEPPIYIPTNNENHSASYIGIPISLEDIQLILDQRSEAQVLLVNYAIVEMHQSDRVLRQFGFRQLIPVEPEVLDDKHKVDLRLLNTDWPRQWSKYIKMWESRYDYIPIREPIIIPELACMPEYMSWFKIHGKPYLLSEEEKRRQIRVQRK